MGTQYNQAFCPRCQQVTLQIGERPRVPHVLYGVLTVFTCGLFAFVWILHILLSAGLDKPFYRCQVCGTPMQPLVPGSSPFAKRR